MKWVIFLSVISFFSSSSFSQDQFTIPSETTPVSEEGKDRALDGGAYKPSSNAPGEYMRALVVFVQFSIDNNYVSDWDSGQLPDWAYNIFDSETASVYTEGTVSDYFKKMAEGDFDFIADVHPNLITLPVHKPYYSANYDVMVKLDEQISDFTIYDNWKFENNQFIFSESNGDSYLDMLIIIYRWGDLDDGFVLVGGIAQLVANFTTHDNIQINGSPTNVLGSGITTNRNAKATYPPTLSIHLAHEYGHYLFGGSHARYGLMTGLGGYYTGGTGAMNSWERKKLGYINYLEASYNGINKTLDDYVTTGDAFRITIPFNEPSSTEYYLIENHQRVSMWDYIIRGGSIGGSQYPNYSVGKGVYIWKVTGNNYPPNITAVTADGSFDWEYIGDFWAGPGWHEGFPWEGWLPKTKRTAVNRFNGKNDRDPKHVPWNDHWASKWVDVDINGNYWISRDVMGDETDAYNIEFNQLLTPWSNPSTTKIVSGQQQPTNISFELVSQFGNNITVRAYSQSASGLALPPSKPYLGWDPTDYGIPIEYGWIYLAWGADFWDGYPIEPDYEWSELQRKIGSGSWVTVYSGPNRVWFDGSVTYDPEGTIPVYFRVRVRDTQDLWSLWSDVYSTNMMQINYAEKYNSGIKSKDVPLAYSLQQNFPNPFNPSTIISYSLQKDGLVTLKVFDILGKEVATLVNERKAAGYYSIDFDASNLPSGIYIYSLTSANFISNKKLILLK